jgi:hypothetical protein
MSYGPPVRLSNRSSEPGIERIKVPTKPALIQGQISSGKLMVIKEMKTIFKQSIDGNEVFNIKNILKPLTEEELQELIVDEEVLIEKEKKAIDNQIKRIQNQQENAIQLEDLKKPK